MINVSQAYKDACESNNRQSYVIAKYGAYNKNAKGQISSVVSNSQEFSNIYKTYNEIKTTNFNYISCEPDRVKLNNSFYFINDKTKSNTNENIAYWSEDLSSSVGAINNKITFTLSEKILFTDITLYFQEVCKAFRVNYYNDNVLVATRNVTNNNNLVVTTKGTTTYSENIYFNKLEIEFLETLLPNRYVKLNEIDFGILQTFTDKQIVDYDIIDELSIDSSELSSNSLNLIIDDTNGEYNVLNPNNKLKVLQEQQELTLYHYLKVGNRYQEIPLGTFYLKEFKVSKYGLEMEAYDDIYFMNDIYYGSKFYRNEEVTNILKDLFNYFDYTNYEIDEELQGIKLSGYIPNVEFREALRLIAEASGSVINKTRYGKTYIFKTYDPISKTFTRKLIDKENPVRNLFNNIITILEYNYSNVIENQEIFNGTLSVGKHTIIFGKYPIDQNTIVKGDGSNNNYNIISTYANSCDIEVIQETNVVLLGTHIQPNTTLRTIKKGNSFSEQQDFAIEKINNPLITTQYEEIGNWKINRGEIKYDFQTLLLPYIEVGDTCSYKTRFNTTNTFIPTRLQFNKSIMQSIEGE